MFLKLVFLKKKRVIKKVSVMYHITIVKANLKTYLRRPIKLYEKVLLIQTN